MGTQTRSGVLVLSGDDKPGTLSVAIQHLMDYAKDPLTSASPTIDMAWVRSIGGPGGVMIRFQTSPDGLKSLLDSSQTLQETINRWPPLDREMQITIRRAPSAAQFHKHVSHQLVYRTDDPRGAGPERHRSNRRSLEHFLTILAKHGVDVAQYESIYNSSGLQHALRLFDYSGQGHSWLLGTVDFAHRSSVVADSPPEEIIEVVRGDATPNSQAKLHPVSIAFQGGRDCPQFERFIKDCACQASELKLNDDFAEDEGLIAVSIHGNDRPGFFADCHRLLESAISSRAATREVVRSCCRGLGQDGFVLAVARGFEDEVGDIHAWFQRSAAAEFNRLTVLAEHADVASERAAFGTVYRTIFDPILPRVVTKFLDLRTLAPDPTITLTAKVLVISGKSAGEATSKLAHMVRCISSKQNTSINFLDLRAREVAGDRLGCAIAIEHPPQHGEYLEAVLDSASQ